MLMDKQSLEDDFKTEHLHLSSVIKRIHADLRRKYYQSNDMDKAWVEHCQDGDTLREYADAMHHLATHHWDLRQETRIDWCRDVALEFFLQGGLKRVFQKEARRARFKNGAHVGTAVVGDNRTPGDGGGCNGGIVAESDNDSDPNNRDSRLTIVRSPGYEDMGTSPVQATIISHVDHLTRGSYNSVTLPFRSKIRLLDVGSCYNPFLAFPEFLSVGIDISPAKPSVYKCDFLHLETTEPLQVANDTFDTFITNLKSPIDRLPRCSFHVVVFSLLLEYFPCPYPRWVCCQRAHDLLQEHGLLLIITPDSSHQNKNSSMMKSWKRAIEEIGFVRWRYEKQEHLHCMAFRKVKKDDCPLVSGISSDLLYIPQDSNLVLDNTNSFMPPITNESDDFFRQTVFELPGDVNDDMLG